METLEAVWAEWRDLHWGDDGVVILDEIIEIPAGCRPLMDDDIASKRLRFPTE